MAFVLADVTQAPPRKVAKKQNSKIDLVTRRNLLRLTVRQSKVAPGKENVDPQSPEGRKMMQLGICFQCRALCRELYGGTSRNDLCFTCRGDGEPRSVSVRPTAAAPASINSRIVSERPKGKTLRGV